MAKPCPRCSLLSADDARQCSCGYDFPAPASQPAPRPLRRNPTYLAGIWLGGFVMALGVYEVFTESAAAGLVSLLFGGGVAAFFLKRRMRYRRVSQK